MFDRQVLWLSLGAGAATILSRFDYHYWRRLVVFAMLGVIILLITVLLIEARLGVNRAIYKGSYQPSELAKLVSVIYLSVWLYAKRQFLHDISFGLIPLGVILGIVGGLIYLQPDLSAAGTVLILGGLLFFLAGSDLRQIALLLLAAVFMGWIVVQFSSTGQDRVISFLAGLQDPMHASYHVQRAFEAVIKGGWFGVGLGQADTKLTGLPFAPTDSIFAVVAEEFGLVGSALLIGLYALSDVAVLGKFTNEGDADIDVVVWMTPGLTSHTTVNQLKLDATKIKLWGAFKVKAGSTVVVDWDESARLFTKEGRAALVTETKGDGTFTLYAIAEQDTYTFKVEYGTLVLVVDPTWDKLW